MTSIHTKAAANTHSSLMLIQNCAPKGIKLLPPAMLVGFSVDLEHVKLIYSGCLAAAWISFFISSLTLIDLFVVFRTVYRNHVRAQCQGHFVFRLGSHNIN